MTATEIEVGKRFSRVAFKMQTPKPKLDRAEGMERWETEGRREQQGGGGAGQDYSSPGCWPRHSLTQRSTCPAQPLFSSVLKGGTACQCKWRLSSRYVYHLPFLAITKQSAFISA